MDAMELFSPQATAQVGDYTFQQGITLEVHSAKDSLFDWAEIKFTQEFQPEVSILQSTPASISMGYDDAPEEIFSGFVAQSYNAAGNANEILLKDKMLLLEQTRITGTFLDTTPQEMIAYFLSRAGISEYKLSAMVYPRLAKVVIRDMNVPHAIEDLHAAWNIRQTFFFSDGIFYWGQRPPQSKIYQFEYGVNILNLTRKSSLWELETVAVPFVHHSQKIAVDHPQIAGTFEVMKVSTTTNAAGFIRTIIYFEGGVCA